MSNWCFHHNCKCSKWAGGHLNSRQHDSHQVVVREQQGTNNTAVTHMLDDG